MTDVTGVMRCSTCHYQYRDVKHYPCSACVNFDRWAPPISSIPPPSYDPKDVAFTSTVSVTDGVKYDKDKPKWSLLPFKALAEVVDVLTYGARKYAPDNWKKVPNARARYIDAAFRHFTTYINGEKNDSETGLNHLAHTICCLLFLLAFDKGEHRGESNNDN